MRFAKKVVVVTGGGGGIGHATARRFAEEGARVATLDLRHPDAPEPPTGILPIQCDLAQSAEIDAAFERVRAELGDVGVLVNNAGVLSYHNAVDTPEEEWDRTMAINVKSFYLCARRAIPMMLRSGGGVVINVSSVQAFVSQTNVAAYTTSKTALLGLTRSIAADFAPRVRCVAVCPGTVDTPMLHWAMKQAPDPQALLDECSAMHLTQRVAKPEEIAALIAFLASDEAQFITGQYVRIDGGLGVSVGGGKKS